MQQKLQSDCTFAWFEVLGLIEPRHLKTCLFFWLGLTETEQSQKTARGLKCKGIVLSMVQKKYKGADHLGGYRAFVFTMQIAVLWF